MRGDGAFERSHVGAETVSQFAHLRSQLGLMIVHERVVDDDQQRFLSFQRLENAARPGVGDHQIRGANVLKKEMEIDELILRNGRLKGLWLEDRGDEKPRGITIDIQARMYNF